MSPNSTAGTFLVATVLCVACSLLVSGAAESLKDRQLRNREVDKKKNVLLSAGLCDKGAASSEVDAIFEKRIREVLIDLATGEEVNEEDKVEKYGAKYDAAKAAKDASLQVPIEPADALMGVRFRAPAAPVYKIVDTNEQVEGYIFPVEGKGLWSTLMGFLALESDGTTVRGITFYKHAETPGLGGEVDNATWKASWAGKQIYGDDGQVALNVVKGTATSDTQIDGLSGATITSKGVDHLVDYWLGENGFGPFIKAQTKGDG